MSLIGKLWSKWSNRHRHVYVERHLLAGEKWRSPAYLTECKCDCGKTYYVLMTVFGLECINQEWAKHYFNSWNAK